MIKILCCGDSHIEVFKYCNGIQDKFAFDVCIVDGATSQGAVNPNSKTDALNIFEKKINSTPVDKILIMLGEVDFEFDIWVGSNKYNITIDEQINVSINNLLKFVDNIISTKNYTNKDIIICGSVLPTIKDNTDKNFLDSARSEVNVSQLERTKKTIEYNNLLKINCHKNGYNYIDIVNDILGKDGIVNDQFLSSNPANHNLDNKKTYNLWLSKLNNILLNRTFYVCSYGGSGSKMLCASLGKYGNVKHIHSRNPPNNLEYVGNEKGGKVYCEWFNGVTIPDNELKNYCVIYIYRNPSFALQKRGSNPNHLQHIQVEPNIMLDDVINTGRDLFKIREFYDNYTKPNKNRNYKIYCVKYEDIFDKQDELSKILGVGKLNLVNISSRKKSNTELNDIYSNLIDEISKNDFIMIS